MFFKCEIIIHCFSSADVWKRYQENERSKCPSDTGSFMKHEDADGSFLQSKQKLIVDGAFRQDVAREKVQKLYVL